MKTNFLLTIMLLINCSSAQLMPIQTEEEVKIDLGDNFNTELNVDSLSQTNKKQFNKIYEIELDVHTQLLKSFKNIIHLVYEKNQSEAIEAQLNNVLKNVNFTEVDAIFVKSPIGQIQNATGVYVHHFQHLYHLTDYTNLNDEILNIISPKLQFFESEEELDIYFSENKLRSLVLLPKEYVQRDFIVSEIEKLIREGNLEEAKLDSIKGYHTNYKTFTAPTLLLYKGEDQFEQYEYNLTYTDQIVDFFYLESLNLVNRLNEDNYARVFGGAVQTQVHLLIENELSEQLYNDYVAVALNNKKNDLKYQRLIFTFSTFQENPSLWELFDFTQQTQKPKLVITETNFRKYQLQKYICQQETLNQESIQQFIDDFRNKNLTEFYKSEPTPQNNDGVLKIVGNSFSQEVLNKGKNVLVLFWDSKNKEIFQDHFNLLNEFEKIQNKDKIKIGHIDLALNEHPKITVDSVPKLLLYLAADKKSPKEYLKSSNLVIPELKAWLDYYLGEGVAYIEEKNDL